MRIYFYVCVLLVLFSTSGNASTGFRYGTITWASDGNYVNFTIQTVFQQSTDNVVVGGTTDVIGTESPSFFYGDSSVARYLKMKVLSFSQDSQWIMGEITLRHRYQSAVDPNGKPWKAQFIGCCRISELSNNAGKPWVLTAEVNLDLADRSPKPAILPTLSVPFVAGQIPQILAAAHDNDNVEWSFGSPFDVGGSLLISPSSSTGSYISVEVGKLYSQSIDPSVNCYVQSSAGGCFLKLLHGKAELKGFTVEGWVKSSSDNMKYIVSTSATSSAVCTSNCSFSTFFIAMDGSSITVGHNEVPGQDGIRSAVFQVCSDATICSQIDTVSGPASGSPLTNRWVHIAVVRTVDAVPAPSCGAGYSLSYQLYVNGLSIGSQSGLCAPLSVPGVADLLLFGTTSVSAPYPGFAGYLQEWRFWHGVMLQDQIARFMMMPLRPDREDFYGDPTSGQVTPLTYVSTSVLLADYSMQVDCAAGGCAVPTLVPVYPKVTSPAFLAHSVGNVTAADPATSGGMFWRSAVTANAGLVDGRVTLRVSGPGLYQVTLFASWRGEAGKIPVDLVVSLDDAAWDVNSSAYRLRVPPAAFFPTVSMLAVLQNPLAQACAAGSPCAVLYEAPGSDPSAVDLSGCALRSCKLRVFPGFPVVLRLQASWPTPGRWLSPPCVTCSSVSLAVSVLVLVRVCARSFTKRW